MNDLTIRHHVPYDHAKSIHRPCVWCGEPTDIIAETPFRPDLGGLPLMLTCGAHMRIVFRILQEEGPAGLDDWEVRRVVGLLLLEEPARMLESGT